MQTALEWLIQHVPMLVDADGTVLGEDGTPILRWPNAEGRMCEASAGFVAERFGTAIEQALVDGADMLDAVLASEFDAGWHDIWRRWRELGYI